MATETWSNGGTVVGAPRHPYGDKVLIWAAPGEEVITNRHGEADRVHIHSHSEKRVKEVRR